MPYNIAEVPRTEGYVLSDMTTPEELEMCDCENCPYKMHINPRLEEVLVKKGIRPPKGPVPGAYYGSKDTPYSIVVVGIAVARDELATGLPFTGQSGRVFKEVMDQLGFTGYYLTNVLLCEPPDGATVSEKEQATFCCSKRLESEILRHKPDLLIALGSDPMLSLIDNPGKVTKMAGRVHEGKYGSTLVGVHPASFLRNSPDMFRDFVDQMETGIRELRGYHSQVIHPEVVVISEDTYSEILNKLDKYPEIVLDIETTRKGLYPYSKPPDGVRCLGLMVEESTAYIFPGESSKYYPDPVHPNFVDRPEVKEMLRGKKLITHNGQFDVAFLMCLGYKDLVLYYDTMLAHIQMDERIASHGLKPLAKKFLGADDWEEDIKLFLPTSKSSYDLIPDARLYTYAGMDLACTMGLYKRFKETVHSGVFRSLIMPCANMFSEIRHKGILVDPEVIMSMDEVLEGEYEVENNNLQELVGHYINPKSPLEVSALLYDEMKLPIIKAYGRKANKKVMSFYTDSPIIQSILLCREISKLQSTYVLGLAKFVDRNFRIHPMTKLYGAVTGRIATEDPSVMNVSTKTRGGGVKRIYIPEEGHYILEADQKQMELRCYCCITGDPVLTELLNASKTDRSKDPHRMIATKVFGAERSESMRPKAKTGVFGRLYGRGKDSFMRDLKLDSEDTDELLSVIDSMFPMVKEYRKMVESSIHQKGYLESFFGRRRRFPLLTRDSLHEFYRQGANFLIQSMASDVNLACMLYLYGKRKELGAYPLFPVHDSVLFDIVDPAVIPILKDEMERYSTELTGNKVEFVEEVKLGKNWGEVKEWKGN
jgi:uracil-DNA glycosylase family 4